MPAETRGGTPEEMGDDSTLIAELRRRLYSRDSTVDPARAQTDRQQLDQLERARAQRQQHSPYPTAHEQHHETLAATLDPEPSDGDTDEGLPPRWRSAVITIAAVAVIAGAAVVAWFTLTAPPTGDALAIFEREDTVADTSPFPADYRLAGGSEIDRLRSLGTFDGWAVWATLMDDEQVCLIAMQDTTSAATCSTRAQFAQTGLTLGVTGTRAASGNAAPQRDLTIMWGPDDPEPTTG